MLVVLYQKKGAQYLLVDLFDLARLELRAIAIDDAIPRLKNLSDITVLLHCRFCSA